MILFLGKQFNRKERSYIKTVVDIKKEKPINITKISNDIVLEFAKTQVYLDSNGYAKKVLTKIENRWV
jgi:hypothetical protein